MKRKWLKSILGLALACIVGSILLMGCSEKASESGIYSVADKIDETQEEFVAEGWEDFRDEIKDMLGKQDFNGQVLVAYDDKPLYIGGIGYASEGVPNTMNTTFEIGSVTKQFTAACILQLQEEGKLSVMDTLDKYFPDYSYADQITLHNMLQMRSGIPEYLKDFEVFKSMNQEKVLQSIYESPMDFTPDTQFRYSNSNYYLLSLIIEQISGKSYEDYLSENIFSICDMQHSFVAKDDKHAASMAYLKDGSYLPITEEMASGAGAIISNVVDLYKWNEALPSGLIINEESFQKMLEGKDNYGYGLMINSRGYGHSGMTLGWFAYNEVITSNDHKTMVILLSNNGEAHAPNISQHSLRVFSILTKYVSDKK